MCTRFTAWHSEIAPPSADILQPFICLNPFSLTTIKRLDFKSESRESRALPSVWHGIKLLGALEPQMGWIPQDVSSAPFLSFMCCLSELPAPVKWMSGVRRPSFVPMQLLIINSHTKTAWDRILLITITLSFNNLCPNSLVKMHTKLSVLCCLFLFLDFLFFRFGWESEVLHWPVFMFEYTGMSFCDKTPLKVYFCCSW